MVKTTIKIFNGLDDREILRTIESPISWKIEGNILRVSYLKNEKHISVATNLPFLVDEGEPDGLNISKEALKSAAKR